MHLAGERIEIGAAQTLALGQSPVIIDAFEQIARVAIEAIFDIGQLGVRQCLVAAFDRRLDAALERLDVELVVAVAVERNIAGAVGMQIGSGRDAVGFQCGAQTPQRRSQARPRLLLGAGTPKCAGERIAAKLTVGMQNQKGQHAFRSDGKLAWLLISGPRDPKTSEQPDIYPMHEIGPCRCPIPLPHAERP